MIGAGLGSLRTRLLALVFVTVLPVVGLIVYTAIEQQRSAITQVETTALGAARHVSIAQEELIGAAQQLLAALAHLPAVTFRDGDRCSALFGDVLGRFPLYANLGAATPEGNVFCSAVRSGDRVNVADRRYFREALARSGFAVGDFSIGRFTGQPTLAFGYSAVDSTGRPQAILFAALNLSTLEQHIREATVPSGAVVTVFDRAGVVVAQHPVGRGGGRSFADPLTLSRIREGGEGVLEDHGDDGSPRLVAFAPIGHGQTSAAAWVAVSTPTAVAVAPVKRLLFRNLIALAVLGTVMLAVAWLASDALVLRRARTLLEAARRLGRGDLGARVGGPYTTGELDQLARAFDEMADGIASLTAHNRLILDAVGEGIYGLDRRGRVTFVNPAAARLSGWSIEELIGHSMHARLHHTKPDGRPYPPEECPSADTLARGVTREVHAEVFWRRDGTSFPVEYVTTPIVRDGQIQGAVVAFKDISERKRTEDELHRQQEALHQTEKVATMGSLLAGVAHELNNPLAVVMGQSLLLRESTREPALTRRAEKIHTAAERCARIVKNFLALARNRPPERGPVEVNRVVREAVELLAYELRTSSVEVDLRLDEALPTITADAHQLHQVLVNLVSNAHHAMRQTHGVRRITVTTAADPEDRRLRVTVSDTGPGIPAEVRARIFEPFFTTKPPGEGTGLGLSLCHSIVEEHGGRLAAESEPGGGATFIVEIPIGRAAEPAPAAAERPAALGVKTILVVDDEPDVAATLAETLQLDGHRVDVAADGAEALAQLERQAYDLIFSDTKMPRLDGVAFYQELMRRFPALRHQVIFVTGDVMDRDKLAFLETTGCLSLTKPFDLDDVRRAVHRVLRGAA